MTEPVAPRAAAIARFREDLAAVWPGLAHGRLLVAVSGGPDSIALLLLARAVLGSRCVAATVDHGIRQESVTEAAFVADVCLRLGVDHAILSAPLPARASRTANLSARARLLRYQLLEDHLVHAGAARLATAHHADDQLETLVSRLNRGAGVAGLAGIRGGTGSIVRPVLGWRRAELAAVVRDGGIPAITDPSNTDDRFDRARLRKQLAGVDWLDTHMWGRSAAALGDAEEALDWTARRLFDRAFVPDGEGGALMLGDGWPPWELARRLVLLALQAVVHDVAPRGAELSRLVRLLLDAAFDEPGHGPVATLAGVRIEARRLPPDGVRISVRPAPPPRAA